MLRRSACILPTIIALLTAGHAHAQDDDDSASAEPRRSHVSIRSSEGSLDLRIVPLGESEAIVECSGHCDFWALPGRYTLYTRDHETGVQDALSLRVKGFSRYDLVQGNDSARDVGLGVGIGGLVSIFTGLVLTMPLLMSSMCEDSHCASDGDRLAAGIGLGALAVGALAAPLGWSVFSHNRTRLRLLDQDPYAASHTEPNVRLGLVALPRGGFGLGGVAAF